MDEIDAALGIDKAALKTHLGSAHRRRARGSQTRASRNARRAITGGRAGHHSEQLGHLLTEMQFLQRAYPGATW